MAPTSLYAHPTKSGHAPDELADGVLGDLIPDLDQGLSDLLHSLWQYLAVLMHQYITSHRCSIGFRSREHEGQSMASMPPSSRDCLHTLATGGTRGPLHQRRSDNLSEDFILVPNSSQGTVGYDMEVCATLQ